MELTVKGNQYSVGKLGAMSQFHIARRIAPVLMAAGGVMPAIANVLSGKLDANAFLALVPLAHVLAGMGDADSEYVLSECMKACQRRQGDGWQRVTASTGAFLFDDIDMTVMVQLAVAVIKSNLGNFLTAPSAQ